MVHRQSHPMHARFADPLATPKGRLIFGIFENDFNRPIENADIKVFLGQENDRRQVESLITDISGQTITLELDSPPKEYSLSPDSPVEPYSKYSVEISADGYIPTFIDGIEIFQDTLAIQDVVLEPTITLARQEKVIHIADHTLWGNYPPKIPEEDVKELPPDTGFVVLPNPVIPEYIVVHDGSPDNNNAPNYYIRFKDYIKNVASCEIYATWPDATIRANILAIISFTLNRVYTEWYRNKGKNFTISSSTAYVN